MREIIKFQPILIDPYRYHCNIQNKLYYTLNIGMILQVDLFHLS